MLKYNLGVSIKSAVRLLLIASIIVIPVASMALDVNEAEAIQVANTFLGAFDIGRLGIEPTTDYNLLEATAISSQDETLAYLFQLSPAGYIILSADDEIEPIIAYSFRTHLDAESMYDLPLVDMIIGDIEGRKSAIDADANGTADRIEKNRNEWAQYALGITPQATRELREVIGPHIQSEWGQGSPYNTFCPLDPSPESTERSVVGCVATATSQIVNYWQYPNRIVLDASDGYVSMGRNGPISIPDDHETYSFPTFELINNNLADISYSGDDTESAYLCFAIGIKQEMAYSANGSGAYTNNDIYDELGYGSAVYDQWANSYYQTMIGNIENGWPLQISIRSTEVSNSGHSVIVDGYDEDNGTYHINMGWYGSEDAWYSLPTIGSMFNVIRGIVYNICPAYSWDQEDADEKNSKCLNYALPVDGDLAWAVSCADDYSFSGLVIGSGGTIYATCDPNDQTGGNNSSLYVIRADGVVLEEITLEGEDEGLKYPAQDKYGNVIIATDLGNVLKYDPEFGSLELLFSDPEGEQLIGSVKVDDDGYIYVASFYSLHCLDETGEHLWSYTFPNDGWNFSRNAAIDVSRDLVYMPYYSMNDESGYLVALNRHTGGVQYSKSFGYLGSTMRAPGTPSIGPDGTIYIGCNLDLYALQPETGLPSIWSYQPGISRISAAPTISRSGVVYLAYWSDVSTSVVASLNAGDHSLNWQIPFGLGDYDHLQEVTCDPDGHVYFTVQRENDSDPDTYTIYVYTDNGDSYTFEWQHGIESSGGNSAFGPNRTIYTIPASGYGHTISAFSQDLTGMGWANNLPPVLPSNPTPISGELGINIPLTLDWTCSDPEEQDLTYTVWLGNSTTIMAPVVSNLTSSSFTISDGLISNATYTWRIVASDGQATTVGPTWQFTTEVLVGLESSLSIPDDYVIYPCFPNPFNPSTTIRYGLPEMSNVQLVVYDIEGRLVASLMNTNQAAGYHEVVWNGLDATQNQVSAGLYFTRIETGDFSKTIKMLFLK